MNRFLWTILIAIVVVLYVLIVNSLHEPRPGYDHKSTPEMRKIMQQHGPLYVYVEDGQEVYYETGKQRFYVGKTNEH